MNFNQILPLDFFDNNESNTVLSFDPFHDVATLGLSSHSFTGISEMIEKSKFTEIAPR